MSFINFLSRTSSPDLTICCKDGDLKCHSLVLASVSLFLKALLLDTDSHTLIVPEVKKKEVEDILEVIYGEKLETDNDETMKTTFILMSVDSKNILIRNITSETDRIINKRSKKGYKLIQYKTPAKNHASRASNKINLESSSYETCVNKGDSILDVVEENTNSEYSEDHAYFEQYNGFACDQREEVCDRMENLAVHEQQKHGKQKFACDQCDKVCKRKENLTTHKKQKHGEHQLEIVIGSRICSFCQQNIKRKDILSHMRNEHPNNPLEFKCDQCEKRFKFKSKLERHRKQHDQKTANLSCQLCAFMTGSEDSLRRHIRRHDNLIKCDLCDYTSPRIEYVEMHYEKKHGNKEETHFKCDICEESFKSKNALKMHKKRYH